MEDAPMETWGPKTGKGKAAPVGTNFEWVMPDGDLSH